MKIDKISDNQIRCILDKEDLSGRGIAPSELAYGSDKARELFIEMLGIAEKKFGFEPDDSPLMVEAIPSANGSLILLISKSEDPQDLDTRFSRFSPEAPAAPLEEEEPTDAEDTEEIDVGDPVIEENDISNLTNKPLPFDDATIGSAIQSLLGIDDLGFKTKPEPKPDFTALPKFLTPDKKIPSEKADVPALKIYSFDSFDALQEAAHALADVFHGEVIQFLGIGQVGGVPVEQEQLCCSQACRSLGAGIGAASFVGVPWKPESALVFLGAFDDGVVEESFGCGGVCLDTQRLVQA